jgi:hypothetical protein
VIGLAKRGGRRKGEARKTEASEYRHTQDESPLRPDVGAQAQFRKKKPPAKYRYDSSLSPALDWDGQNPAREQGEARIAQLQAEIATLHDLKSPRAGEGHLPAAPPACMSRPWDGRQAQAGGEGEKPVAFVFGPENGAVSEKLVYEAAQEGAQRCT